jgi:hypothetical protein
MKKTILISVLLFYLVSLKAQDKKETSIIFGAIIGTKVNNFEKHFIADVEPNLYSFSIGAGSSLIKNNFVIGIEFLYSNANKDNDTNKIQYVGFDNTVYFGYNFSKNKKWIIEPNVGFVLSNNQIIVENNNSYQNLTNNQLAGSLGINVKFVNKQGLFTGIKVGYITPFSGKTEWKIKLTESKTELNDNIGSFFIQLNLGGLIDLIKTNEK